MQEAPGTHSADMGTDGSHFGELIFTKRTLVLTSTILEFPLSFISTESGSIHQFVDTRTCVPQAKQLASQEHGHAYQQAS